ncbi:DUF1178 family protein [Alphaproteobacteria bacterium]|nr:DUF1178 family protein [Alphaproteobacteria bacterium]
MIKYKLKCKSLCCVEQNNFDGWFQNIETFEKQMNLGLISCPICGDENIEKLLTTPSLKKIQNTNNTNNKEKIYKDAFGNQKAEKITTILRSIKKQMKKNSTFVGDEFVKKARSMNEGLIEEKSIYGHGTKEEIEELRDEGVDVINMPWTPDDH